MKYIPIYLLMLLLLASCKDNFNIDDIKDEPRLVVYCFPSTADTTFIQIWRSVPVRKGTVSADSLAVAPVDAHIVYQVNGESRQVVPTTNNTYAAYYVLGRQKAGDKIALEASADGCRPVTASTRIPAASPVDLKNVKIVHVVNSDGESNSYNQAAATFTAQKPNDDYYAVRVRTKNIRGQAVGTGMLYGRQQTLTYQSYNEYTDVLTERPELKDWTWTLTKTDSTYVYPDINTDSEPLLNGITEIDSDFGFSMDFYQNCYIFDAASVSGQSYTLHLNVDNYWKSQYTWGWETLYPIEYQVELYHVTPTYYRFLKSINDARNNDWAKVGLRQIAPTYSNVNGGLGVVAGYNASVSGWMTEE
jgi:hypothetical protein